MKDPSLPQGERGYGLLLEHCTVLNHPAASRPPAILRLEQAVGHDLARLLVGALATRPTQRVPA
jgi:hypothetical protein